MLALETYDDGAEILAVATATPTKGEPHVL
jgi:hypothetical protein